MSESLEEREALAGEYVIGTLSATERAEADTRLSHDADFAAAVARWRDRLAPLDESVEDVTPPNLVWEGLSRRIDTLANAAKAQDHDVPGAQGADVIAFDLSRRVRFWRRMSMGAGAIAASLAAILLADPSRLALPALTGNEASRYVAVVNRGGELPALIVTVDAASEKVTVRSLAAEQPAGKSLEVWYVAGGAKAPVSLGVLREDEDITSLTASRETGLDHPGGAIAISLEPRGGSPTGAPTGPVVYSGKLVKAD